MKIVAEFDTKDKSLVLTIDGKKVKNVSDVNIFTFSPDEANEYNIDVVTIDRRGAEEEGVVTRTHLQASDSNDCVEQIKTENEYEKLSRALFSRNSI
tara:strand:+ start:12840 stop:13130 length:291 start_codon:yes stop_codon:yes gene_type:complete